MNVIITCLSHRYIEVIKVT